MREKISNQAKECQNCRKPIIKNNLTRVIIEIIVIAVGTCLMASNFETI